MIIRCSTRRVHHLCPSSLACLLAQRGFCSLAGLEIWSQNAHATILITSVRAYPTHSSRRLEKASRGKQQRAFTSRPTLVLFIINFPQVMERTWKGLKVKAQKLARRGRETQRTPRPAAHATLTLEQQNLVTPWPVSVESFRLNSTVKKFHTLACTIRCDMSHTFHLVHRSPLPWIAVDRIALGTVGGRAAVPRCKTTNDLRRGHAVCNRCKQQSNTMLPPTLRTRSSSYDCNRLATDTHAHTRGNDDIYQPSSGRE